MFSKIVVVCTANICRSPMAEAILQTKLVGGKIRSAGTSALSGYEAAPYTRQVMLSHGYDVSRHRAQQATASLLLSMDLILAVDKSHAEWIVRNFPHLRGRVHKIGKWNNNIDIEDPYGGPVEGYEAAYQLIDSCVTAWLPYFRR